MNDVTPGSICDPDNDFIKCLSRLSTVDRNATLGLLGGLIPPIAVQTLCPETAKRVWSDNHLFLLRETLNKIKFRLPINVLAIEGIARNVFVTRNTLSANGLAFPIGLKQNDKYQMFDLNTESNHFITLINSYTDLSQKFNSISAMDSSSLNDSFVNGVIEPHFEKIGHLIDSRVWIGLLKEFVIHLKWLMEGSSNYVDNSNYDFNTIKEMIETVFRSDILPIKYLEEGHSILPIVETVFKYRTILFNTTKPSTESFDSIHTDNYFSVNITDVLNKTNTENTNE